MARRILSLVIASTLVVALPAGLASQPTAHITVADFSFRPAHHRVTLGDSGAVEVRWVNNGPSPHTVTADAAAFNSGTLAAGATFAFRFQSEGTFAYHCGLHENMRAQIEVVREREPGY